MILTTAFYPGSFDPIHYGHIDIVHRAAALFDHLVVGVYYRPQKNLLFSEDERLALSKAALADLPNVEVHLYTGLTVEYARTINATTLVRGLRVISDFELEYQMALTNQQLAPQVDTVCLMTRLEYAFISSSVVKEVFFAGGDISKMVPSVTIQAMEQKRSIMASGKVKPVSL